MVLLLLLLLPSRCCCCTCVLCRLHPAASGGERYLWLPQPSNRPGCYSLA
jgi:hypothetical protein